MHIRSWSWHDSPLFVYVGVKCLYRTTGSITPAPTDFGGLEERYISLNITLLGLPMIGL